MNLKLDIRKLTVVEFLNRTAESARAEQAATLKLLEHLAEVERRKAYAGRTASTVYTSLFDYLKRGLNYSDSQAAERVAATKLLLQAPSIKPALESGKLSLTSAAQVQRFVERERRLSGIVHLPQQITAAIEGKSKREVEQELFNRASPKTQAAMNERVRPILMLDTKQAEKIGASKARQVQVSATVDENLIHEARSLVYIESVSELIERALKLYVQHHTKRRGKVGPRASMSAESTESDGVFVTANAPSPCRQSSSEVEMRTQVGSALNDGDPKKPKTPAEAQRKYPARTPRSPISIHLKRAIWSRARAQCEFKSDSGERCPAIRALEIDHRLPVSVGGANSLRNLQLLCRTHNQIKGQTVV